MGDIKKRATKWYERHRALVHVTGLAVLVVGFFIFHIWFRTLVLTSGYEVGARRKAVAALESELAAVRVERTKMMSPENLHRLVEDWEHRGTADFSAPESSRLIYSAARK